MNVGGGSWQFELVCDESNEGRGRKELVWGVYLGQITEYRRYLEMREKN